MIVASFESGGNDSGDSGEAAFYDGNDAATDLTTSAHATVSDYETNADAIISTLNAKTNG